MQITNTPKVVIDFYFTAKKVISNKNFIKNPFGFNNVLIMSFSFFNFFTTDFYMKGNTSFLRSEAPHFTCLSFTHSSVTQDCNLFLYFGSKLNNNKT